MTAKSSLAALTITFFRQLDKSELVALLLGTKNGHHKSQAWSRKGKLAAQQR
jgi:hypothetical protein